MKNAMQLKAIMKKLAKENQISAQLVLQNYMLERFLERVSLSPYRDIVAVPSYSPFSNRKAAKASLEDLAFAGMTVKLNLVLIGKASSYKVRRISIAGKSTLAYLRFFIALHDCR